MIYAIQNTRNGYIKIGYTSVNPKIRLCQLQTGSADELKLIATWPGDKDVEGFIHWKLRRYRRQGEWFQGLSLQMIREMAECAQVIEAQTQQLVLPFPDERKEAA